MELIIRTYNNNDEKELISLWKECNLVVPWNDPLKDIQRKLDENPKLFFVGTMNNTIVGSCMAGYDGHRGWIYYLATKPSLQKKGMAKQLVQHAQAVLASMGCPKINLMIRKTNEKVIQFYKNIGYNDDPVMVLSKRLKIDGPKE